MPLSKRSMADNSSPDYKSLYLQAEERRKQEEERRKQEEERRKGAEEREKQAEEREKQEAEGRRQAEQRNQQTSFTELLQHCHDIISRQLRVETPSRSTTGKIPAPTGKFCPIRLEHWADCPEQMLRIYNSVCKYLQPELEQVQRLFSSLPELEGLGRRFARKPLSSEQDLEAYERFRVEEYVHDIIAELCQIPAARAEFGLGDGIQFSNHTHSLSRDETVGADENHLSSTSHPQPDQFCIHWVDGNTNTLLTTVEYKPSYKLPKTIVRSNKIPTDQDAKLRYNAERLAYSAVVQEYHTMFEEGYKYSYVTNGLTHILLCVPQNEPTTLYYFFYNPHSEVDPAGDKISQLLKTSIARSGEIAGGPNFIYGKQALNILIPRFRAKNCSRFPTPIVQTLSFRVPSLVHPMIRPYHPRQRLPQIVINGESAKSCLRRPHGDRVNDRSQGVTKKIILDAALHNFTRSDTGEPLDELCPNLNHHRKGQNNLSQHPISVEDLMILLKSQLDKNIDCYIPFGRCGSYGISFKLIYMKYSYTVIGKGTTLGLWKEVSREAQVY
ncbi:uncharacterized protein N7483_010328 [Penicillium malachiteum]|uniref:uncharacterized protein n=1 Tax=Penicillium malachiteum TaxID=1324776 RepID=UPI002548B87B|nr:uncharacterized protein N7483_010328 [Penicillium malachiteum]KAJ5713147.1 hypothetical protein N7483_010328 [Penicillium malachiteum]